MEPGPRSLLLAFGVVLKEDIAGPIRIGVGGENDDSEFGVREDGSAVVEHEIYGKFHTAADDPAKGAEMVVDDVVEHEGVVSCEAVFGERWEIGGCAEECKELLVGYGGFGDRVEDRESAKGVR